uniref:protein LDOC1-like n=1 Tax=Oncorhynchus gorbuscha TaxID=8017 RepID=UPI001EAF8CEA|nr:protein LDOC1-like [Oncorhynchus gorbuscha]
MTDPADSDQLHNAVSQQGATIGRHKELLHCLMEGLFTLAVSQEPRLPPPEHYAGDSGNCRAFLSQCSLIFELQFSSFPSDHSKIAYLIMLMSGRALNWAMVVWEQQSAVCLSLEEFVAEV